MTVDFCPGDQHPKARPGVLSEHYRCVWFRGAHLMGGDFDEHLIERYDEKKKG